MPDGGTLLAPQRPPHAPLSLAPSATHHSPPYDTSCIVISFFFNDTATTEIYTLSLHDALPISASAPSPPRRWSRPRPSRPASGRSEEHTSELQSRVDISYAVFCLKKKKVH